MPLWLQVLICLPLLIGYGWFIIWFDRWKAKRDQKKFLMFLRMQFPDAVLTYRSVSGKSEHDALDKLIARMQGYEGNEP